MNNEKSAVEKLKHLTKNGWLIPGDIEDESNLELLKMALPIVVTPKVWYSIDEAYRIQMELEKESS